MMAGGHLERHQGSGSQCRCRSSDGGACPVGIPNTAAAAPLLRRSARWSRSRRLPSTPRPCLPGESSNPGVGWAAAAPGASCPPWRRRLGKVGALGACSSCRWAPGVCRVDGVYIRCRFQIQPQVAQRRCFAMPRRVGALETGRKGIGFPFLAAAASLVPIRLVLEVLGPNLRHGAWQLHEGGGGGGGG